MTFTKEVLPAFCKPIKESSISFLKKRLLSQSRNTVKRPMFVETSFCSHVPFCTPPDSSCSFACTPYCTPGSLEAQQEATFRTDCCQRRTNTSPRESKAKNKTVTTLLPLLLAEAPPLRVRALSLQFSPC